MGGADQVLEKAHRSFEGRHLAELLPHGAYELRNGAVGTPTVTADPDIVGALTIDQIFDAPALRVGSPRAWSTTLTIDWNFTDENVVHRMQLRNGLLVHFDTD